jgi:hypothetical protein
MTAPSDGKDALKKATDALKSLDAAMKSPLRPA